MKKNKDRKSSFIRFLILGLLLWVLIGYILYPALKTLQISLIKDQAFSFENYSAFFMTESYLVSLKNSVILGILTVIICGIIGTTLAFFVHYFDLPFNHFIDKLLLLPVVLPGLIIVFAFVQLYGESGLVTKTIQTLLGLEEIPFHLTGLKGILFVHAYTQYVYFYMNVSLAIKHIDSSAIDAAKNLGASSWQIFKSILLPFIKPALIASSIITFMTGIGSFSAPSIIGGSYKVMTTQILLSKANNFMDVAATQVIILTLISLIYLGLLRFYENRIKFLTSVKSTPLKPKKIKNMVLRWTATIIPLILVLFIVLPIITIFILSFVKPGTWMIDIYPREFSLDNYIKIFSKKRALAPFTNSIIMAAVTAILCAAVAIPSSFIVTKTKSKFKPIIELLIMLPWAIPSSAIAINMINAFNKSTIFTGGRILVGGYILLPIAYFVSLVPLMFRSANISFQNLNDVYIEASKSLRANRLQTLRRIILPFLTPGMMAGIILIVIRCLGEYTISAFLYTVSNKPISIAMVNGIFEYEIGLSMAYGALVVVFAFLVNITIRKLQKS